MAQGLTESCAEMWTSTKSGLAPEYVHIRPKAPYEIGDPVAGFASQSFLRPETAESLSYLFRLTGDPKWRKLGKKIFRAIVKHAKIDGGFASVRNVNEEPTVK